MEPARKFSSPFDKAKHIHLDSRALVVGFITIMLGLFSAKMIVSDKWQYAAVVIFSIPAILVLQRYPFLSILIWLVCTPFLLHTTSATTRQVYWVIHRFLPVLTLGVILLPSILGNKTLPKLGFPEYAMLCYAVVSLCSILLLNPVTQSTFYLFYDRVIIPMVLYLIVRLSSPDEQMIRWLIPVTFFIVISQSSIGVISWFSPRALPAKWVDYENHRTIGTLINTNTYVTTLILAGFLLFHFGMQSSSKQIQLGAIGILLLTLYCIFISFSRAGWLAGVLTMIGLTTIYPKSILKLGLIAVPTFLIIGVFFLQNQLAWAAQRFKSGDSEQSALSRLPVYAAAVGMFQEKPFFGWGYGNFDRYDRQFQSSSLANLSGDNKDHASHNFFLSILAEQGLIGILLYLMPVLYWLRMTFKHFSKLPREKFWGRKILVVLWISILSHIIVYNFANMRVIFGLGAWWLTLGLISRYMDAHQSFYVQELIETVNSQQLRLMSTEQKQA